MNKVSRLFIFERVSEADRYGMAGVRIAVR